MKKSTQPQGRGPRQLSPQRSDSGYGGSDAGSTSSRLDQDPKRRHTVGEFGTWTGLHGGGIMRSGWHEIRPESASNKLELGTRYHG